MDHHASRVVRDYGAEILRAAPPGAVLFTKGDLITNTTRYLQLAEGMRPDVRVIDQELLGYRLVRARRFAQECTRTSACRVVATCPARRTAFS